jgi:autotransporter-associated beta strand protein
MKNTLYRSFLALALLALCTLNSALSTAEAATYTLGTTALVQGPAAGSNIVVLGVSPPSAAWSNTANVSWLHLSAANQNGTGSTNVVFSYDANTGTTRTGSLTIAGQTLTVTQAGSTYLQAGLVTTLVSSGLNDPIGVAVDGVGNVYVADSGDDAIKEWMVTSNTLKTVISDSGLGNPYGVAVDSVGNVYIADAGYNLIRKWTVATSTLSTLVSNQVSDGLALDKLGNVYIADSSPFEVNEWLAASNTLITLFSNGVPNLAVALDAAGDVFTSSGAYGTLQKWTAANNTVTTLVSSGLTDATGVAVDGSGNVYIADKSTSVINKWSPLSGVMSPLVSSGLNKPWGLAVDGLDNVYIGDSSDNAVKELPYAFVDPTPKMEGLAAGSDVLPTVLPSTENLLAPFAPTSDQSWLTITSVSNGVVNFAFTATTTNRTGHITLLGQSIPVTQSVAMNPVVTWPTPDPITYGTALSSNQLDASANVPGTFIYNPPAGTVLPAGTNTLSAVFDPSNTIAYTSITDTVSLVVTESLPANTNYIGNSLTDTNGAPDLAPTLVILGEYSPGGPLPAASPTTTLTAGTIQEVQFYGQNYDFTLYALSYIGTGSNANEQTFQVVASEHFAGSAPSPGIQSLPVSGFSVNAGDLLAFAGTGPYYSRGTNDALNSDATYEDSTNADSFTATPPGGPGTVFTVGLNPDTNANYEYVPDYLGNQGRTYDFGVQASVRGGSGTVIYYWDPQGSNPQTPYSGNWENSSWSTLPTGQTAPVPWMDGSQACFAVNSGGPPAFSVAMADNHIVAGINDGANYLNPPLSCNVTITGPGQMTLPSGSQEFAIANDEPLYGIVGFVTIENVIAGTGSINKSGTGTLALNGVNTYNSGTTISGGVVQINGDDALGAATGFPAINLTLNGGCLMASGNMSIYLDADRTISLGADSGYFDVPAPVAGGAETELGILGQVTGTGSLCINQDSGYVLLYNPANNYTGNTFIGAAGPGYNAAGTAACLQLAAPNVIPSGPGYGDVYIYAAYKGQLDLDGGNAAINGLNGNGMVLNSMPENPTILTVGNNNHNCAFSGAITGNIALTKVGSGVLALTGTSTYSGGTTINGGSLNISADACLGAVPANPTVANVYLNNGSCLQNNSGAVTLNANRTIELGAGGYLGASGYPSAPLTINGAITGTGPLYIRDDGAPVVLANTGNNYVGHTTIIGATEPGNSASGLAAWLQLGNANVLPGDVYIHASYKGQLDLNGFNDTINGLFGDGLVINSAASPCTLTVSRNGNFSGTIEGSMLALAVSGSATLTLSGASTYSGGTTVDQGTLLVINTTGSGTGSGAVIVNFGGTLGGLGVINGPTIVQPGCTLAPGPGAGNSIGTLTFGSSLTLEGTTSINVEAGVDTSDAIRMTSGSTVNLGGTLTVLDIDGMAFSPGETFQLIYGSISGAFSSFNLPALPNGWLWDTSQLAPGGNGTITVILPPPQISSFTPLAGDAPQSLQPGTTVTITGVGFAPNSQVQFGHIEGSADTSSVSLDGTQIQVQVPRYGTTGQLTVSVPGQPPFTSTQCFTVNCYRNTYGFSFENDFPFIGYNLCGSFTTFFGESQTLPVDFFGNCLGSANPLVDAYFGFVDAFPQNGNCEGFCLASQRFMHGDESYSGDPSYGSFPLQAGLTAETVWNLQGPEPPTSTGASQALTNYIHAEQLAVFSQQFLSYFAYATIANEGATSVSMSNSVWGALVSGDHPVMVLVDGFSAHSVVAYDLEPPGSGSVYSGSGSVYCYIDVYDPNRPFTINEINDTTGMNHQETEQLSRIILTTDNQWQFWGSFNVPPDPPPPWTGGFDTLLQYNYNVVPVTPTMPITAVEPFNALTAIIFGGEAQATQVSDAAGHTLLNADGTLNQNTNTSIPMAVPYAPPAGSGTNTAWPMFLFATNGTYTCDVSGASTGTYSASIVHPQYIARVIDTQTSTNMNDTISLVTTTPGLAFSTSATNKPLCLQVMAALTNSSARVATVNTTTYNGGNDTLEFADPQSQTVTFTHNGPATTFTLVLMQSDSQGNPATFTSSTLNVASNASVTFSPSNWAALASAPVTMTSINTGGQQQTTLHSTGPGQFLANGAFALNLPGQIGSTYLIEASTNLLSWIPLAMVTNVSGVIQFTDTNVSQFGTRYYSAEPQ